LHTTAGNNYNGARYDCALANATEEEFGEEKSVPDTGLN
jgi:hypothetical protein